MRKKIIIFVTSVICYLGFFVYFEGKEDSSKTEPWPQEYVESNMKDCSKILKSFYLKHFKREPKKSFEPVCRCITEVFMESDEVPFFENPLSIRYRKNKIAQFLNDIAVSEGHKCEEQLKAVW